MIDIYLLVMSERFGSGVIGLDELIGGGYITSSGVVLLGPIGVGKSILSRQFIWNGLVKGDQCLIVSYDHALEDIKHSMLKCDMDISPFLENEQLKIIDYYRIDYQNLESNSIPNEYTAKGLIDIFRNYESKMAEAFSQKKRFRAVIDSISPLLSLVNILDLFRLAHTMSSYARKYNGGGIITLHRGAQQRIFEVLTTQMTENVIELDRKIKDDRIEYQLYVSKFLNIEHSKRVHKYVLSKKGIEMVA